MILDRVYNSNPKGAAAYKDLLAQKPPQFGIDPAELAGMKKPVLTREIPDTEFAGANSKQNAVTNFNKKGTVELTPAERAIADSRRVAPETLDHLAGLLDAKGPTPRSRTRWKARLAARCSSGWSVMAWSLLKSGRRLLVRMVS